MIQGNEIWFEFGGGVNSALDPGRIGEDELADSENVTCRDGTARLDRRYILVKPTSQPGDLTPQGCGHGKFETGSLSEQYAYVASNVMRQVELVNGSPGAFTAVNGAGSLANGDWFFEQFERYLYCCNATAGLGRKLIAPGTDGTGDFGMIKRPSAPTTAPGLLDGGQLTTSGDKQSFVGGTITDSGAGVSAVLNANNDLVITTTAAGSYWVKITLSTSPDRRIDSEYRDIWRMDCVRSNPANMPVPRTAILEGTTEFEPILYGKEGINGEVLILRLQNIARSNRNQITDLKFYITAPSGTNTVMIGAPWIFRVWLSLPLGYNPPDFPTPPAFQPLKWACTYYNQATGLESPPSPILTIPAAHQWYVGGWAWLLMGGTNEAGVSHIRFYRVVGETGNETYYRMASVSNAGAGNNASHIDKLALDEAEALPILFPGEMPQGALSAIATWQNRLCLAAGSLVYVSRNDDELVFEPLTGSADEFDEGRGLTFYADDKKAETVLGLAVSEALYVVTDRSIRALFGTSPSNWRYVKLPEAEGACGPRAWSAYREGVIVLTPSGRLIYVRLGLESPVEIGAKVRSRIGNAGIKALAGKDAVVSVAPDGEIHVRNSTGRYYVQDDLGKWRKGTHKHGTHSALFVSGLPVRWLGSNGRLYEGGDDSYVSDGGSSGTNGEPVTGYVLTRAYSLPRSSVENVHFGDSGETIALQGGSVLLPKVDIISSRGERSYTKRRRKNNVPCSVLDSGTSVQFRFWLDKNVQLRDIRARLKALSGARNT